MPREDDDTRDLKKGRKRKLSPESRTFVARLRPSLRTAMRSDDTGSVRVGLDQAVGGLADIYDKKIQDLRQAMDGVLRERDALAEANHALLEENEWLMARVLTHPDDMVRILVADVNRWRDRVRKSEGR